MDLGVVISYIIAGILIVIIVTVGYNVNYSSNELTLQETQKSKVGAVIETLNYDLPKIGYNQNALPDTLILQADSTLISFYSNIDNSADGSLELITWEYTNAEITETENPDDHYITRTINGITSTIGGGITRFRINYYDELGSTSPLSVPISAVSNKSLIDSIVQIEIIIESGSAIGLQYLGNTNKNYMATAWTKRYSPSNLNIN